MKFDKIFISSQTIVDILLYLKIIIILVLEMFTKCDHHMVKRSKLFNFFWAIYRHEKFSFFLVMFFEKINAKIFVGLNCLKLYTIKYHIKCCYIFIKY